MNRKLTALLTVMTLLLASCGGNKISELARSTAGAGERTPASGANEPSYSIPGASNQSGYFRAEGAEEAEAEAQPAPAKTPMTFEMKKEMLSYEITDRVMQIYDIVLDYSGKYTMAEVMAQFDNSVVEFRYKKGYEYVPDEWLGTGTTRKEIIVYPSHEAHFGIGLICGNPTDDIIELKDAAVHGIGFVTIDQSNKNDEMPYTVYIWFPRGIRIDAQGLNYDNIPALFPQYECQTDFDRIPDGLSWDASQMCYRFRLQADEAYHWDGKTDYWDGKPKPLYAEYWFLIDSKTKEVKSFDYRVSHKDYSGVNAYFNLKNMSH